MTEPDSWRLWQLSDLSTPWALRVAVTLGLADRLADGPRPVAELAAECGVHAGALTRLLEHLSAREVFVEAGVGVFGLADDGLCLCTGHPSRMAEWLDLDSAAGRMDRTYARLLDSVRTGRAAYAEEHGRAFYDDLEAEPALQESFDRLMGADSADYEAMVDQLDWSGIGHLVDVGGGKGQLLAYLLRRHDHLHGTLFELPGTAEVARRLFAEHGLADRCGVVTGDFRTEVRPSGADAYLLVSVLHNWSDQDAVAILRRTAEAAGPGGRVLLVEGGAGAGAGAEAEDNADQEWATHLDLKMLVLLGGRERTVEEYVALAADAGLSRTRVTTVTRGPFALPYAVLDLVVDR